MCGRFNGTSTVPALQDKTENTQREYYIFGLKIGVIYTSHILILFFI